MTALTANRVNSETLDTGRIWRTFPVAADAVIWAGALVAVNTDGYLEPASADTTLRVVGVACSESDATDLANGTLEIEVDSNPCLMVNGSSSITGNDVEALCYVVDDQTVHLSDGSTAGTAQVTRGDVVFSTTDEVGVVVDGLVISVPSNTSDDQTATDLLAKWNAHPVAKAMATATIDTSGAESWFILTFKDTATHTVVEYSPATAGVVSISNTTAAVAATAATRPVAGRIHQVDSRGVHIRPIDL